MPLALHIDFQYAEHRLESKASVTCPIRHVDEITKNRKQNSDSHTQNRFPYVHYMKTLLAKTSE